MGSIAFEPFWLCVLDVTAHMVNTSSWIFHLPVAHSNDQYMLLFFSILLESPLQLQLDFYDFITLSDKELIPATWPCIMLPSNPWNIEIINHIWYYFFWFILCSVRESIIWLWRLHSIFIMLTNEVIESFTLYMWCKI